jgi:PD-(D/E)XK nuclease superfamily protein
MWRINGRIWIGKIRMIKTILDPEALNQIAESFSEGLTQSEMMTRMNCIRKWYFRYVKRIKKQGTFSWALLFGDAVHQMLEEYYSGAAGKVIVPAVPDFRFESDVILRPDQIDDHEYYRGLAEVLIKQHNRYWETFDNKSIIEKTEEEVEYEYRGLRLRAKVDMVLRPHKSEGIFILDHKTCSDFSLGLFAGWSFRFQFLFYAWMFWRRYGEYPAGMYVNAIKKPAERRSVKRQESVRLFLKRIEGNVILDPDKYFKRERLPFDKTTLPRFEKYTLNPIISQFEQVSGLSVETWEVLESQEYFDVMDSLLISMNSDHCWSYNRPCEFLDLCANDFQDFAAEYITMDVKHSELSK